MTIDLNNKTAFITGASRGIGEAVARKLGGCGANVVLAARSEDDVRRISGEIGDNALSLACDVGSYESVRAAMQMAEERFGRIDILVNNAGIIDPIARLEHSDPDAWGRVIETNLKGVYHCLHAVHPVMQRHGGGLIVNISSGAATSALEGWSHYCASKAAVLSLTRCAHKEWAEQGIRVVGLSPGTVATDMQVKIRDSGVNPVSRIDWSSHISPERVGDAVAWLTTDAARQFDGEDFSLKSEESRRLIGLGA